MPISNPAAGAKLYVSEVTVYNGAAPTSWTDLDLSGTVGAKSTLVLLKICLAATLKIAFRPNGDTDSFYNNVTPGDSGYGCSHVYTTNSVAAVILVQTDSAGIIEWQASSALNPCPIKTIAWIN